VLNDFRQGWSALEHRGVRSSIGDGVRGIRRDAQGRRGRQLVAILLVAVFASAPTGSLDPISAATVAKPGPITIGDIVSGNATLGVIDKYPLFVAADGATVVVRAIEDSCGCTWSLTGPNGPVFDESLADRAPQWLAGGEYTLAVTATVPGPYRFQLTPAPALQSFTTTLGATVGAGAPAAGAGSIEVPGAQDAYAFTVPAAGASVVFRDLSNACGCEWSLRKMNGPVVFDRRPMEAIQTGLAAGNYLLRIVGDGAMTGSYSFATASAPAAQRFTVALGDSVSNGVPEAGAGKIEVPGALDVYSVAATPGLRVSITGSACSADISYALVAPSGRILLHAKLCDANDVIELPDETGDYEVRVSATDIGATATYELTIAESSDPAPVTFPAANVFTLPTGATVVNGSPETGAGNIEVEGAHDVYVFEDKTTDGCSGLLWSVYAPSGEPIVIDQKLGCVSSRSLSIDSTGRYNIDVHGSAAVTGTYSFVVRVAPAPQQFAIAAGTTVSSGVPAAGAGQIEAAGAIDLYSFTATRGQTVAVVDTTGGGCVPIDAVIVSPDDTLGSPLQLGCTGEVTLAVERSGTFAVVVTPRAASTGAYSVWIRTSPLAATGLTVAKREGAVRVSWTPPTATGRSPITNAQLTVFNASGGKPAGVTGALVHTVGSAAAAFTFTGLTNGVSYRFVVREQNANGLGVPSVLSPTMAPAANAKPNILFIVTDDQRFDAIAQLPKLNAQTSWLRFANSFVNEPMCCPSRSTIFTGRYSHHTNVQTLLQGRNLDDRTTIATMLRGAGYRTGFLGKYLNGYPFAPGHHVPPGWDTFEAYEGSTDYYNYTINQNGTPVTHGRAPADYSTDVWTGRASNFIRTADAAKPFFLEVAYNAPHFSTAGVAVPAPRDVGSCNGESFPLAASFNQHDQIDEPAWMASQPPPTPTSQLNARRQVCEALRAVDDGVTALIDQLASIGRLTNTYVVLMSDNGYEFGEHRLIAKGDLYDESIRVPLIVRGPGVVPGVTNRLTSNIDIVPTFLAWAKTSPPVGFVDGSSWAANARGATAGATFPTDVLLRGCRSSYQQAAPPCGGYFGAAMGMNWGLRTATYKYIEYPSGYKQLFDLAHDPHELRNIAKLPAYAALIVDLHARLVARRGP
jgi:N-acetylglucosamine-6-sulfatase